MFKNILALLLVSLVFNAFVWAHSGKPKHHVIVDTDGAIDDMRAISMFLAQNDTRVLAITCSQGTLNPDSIFVKVTKYWLYIEQLAIQYWSGFDRNEIFTIGRL